MMPKSTATSLAGVVDEQVAGMHVGVEEAVAQRMAQEGLDHRAREVLEIVALGFEPGAVGERRRLDPFEREHVARGAVPVHRGHAEIGIVPGVLRHLRERGRLEPQIHLDRDRARERLRPPRPAAAAALPPTIASALRAAKVKASRSTLKRCSMPGRSTFTATGRRSPSATTSARCTCAIEAAATGGPNDANSSRSGLFEGGLDHALGLCLRERRHLVLQRLEIARQRHADHVRPRRQELAELHIAGPEPGERGRQGGWRRRLARRPLDQPRRPIRRRARGSGSRVVSTSANTPSRASTNPARPRRTRCDQTRDHNRQPECSATMPPVMRWNDTRRKPAARIISANTSGRGKRRIDSTR